MAKNKLTLLIADDHPLFRAGVKQTLEKLDSVEIFEAEEGNEALQKILNLKPDIAVIDLQMPGKTGLEILSSLIESKVATKIILLTMHKNINYFYQAVSLGVKGYLLKETAVDDLIIAVETVGHGDVFISSRLKKLIESQKKSDYQNKVIIDSINSLTKSEKEILRLIAEWKSNSEIAGILFNSIRTIENHRQKISEKLNLQGTHSLIKFTIENKELF